MGKRVHLESFWNDLMQFFHHLTEANCNRSLIVLGACDHPRARPILINCLWYLGGEKSSFWIILKRFDAVFSPPNRSKLQQKFDRTRRRDRDHQDKSFMQLLQLFVLVRWKKIMHLGSFRNGFMQFFSPPGRSKFVSWWVQKSPHRIRHTSNLTKSGRFQQS